MKAQGVDVANRASAEVALLLGAAGFRADSPVSKIRRDLAGSLGLSGLVVDNASRLAATHCAACAVHGRIERVTGMLVFHSFENDRLLTHGSADESTLSGKRRCSALAYNPQLLAFVLFAPRVVVMVVHLFDNRRSQDLGHAAADPVTTRIGVITGQTHSLEVLSS